MRSPEPPEDVIAIVDDDPVMRSLMAASLEEAGFTVVEAENGAEALRLCRESVPALLVADVVMPVMDGFALCRALRERPETAFVPILMATGLDDEASITEAYEAGATDFISKPLNWLVLNNRVRYMLRAARAFDELRMNQDRLLAARDEAEAASRAKSEFLANMSHELRTPLNAVIGFSSLMRERIFGPLDDRYAEYATVIEESGQHLLTIINEILDITKAETNRLTIDSETIDIEQLVAFTIRMVQQSAREGQVRCTTRIDPGLPGFVADAAKLRQVLINLLTNAVKFTPAGGEVTLEVSPSPQNGVRFRVCDTGIGIAPDKIGLALSPFGQIDAGLSRHHGGVGLGLPLAKRLVEVHGGTFDIDSAPGAGTTITVDLPADQSGTGEGASAVAAE